MLKCLTAVIAVLSSLFWCAPVRAQVNPTSLHSKIDDITTSRQIEDLLRSLNPEFSTFHVNDSLQFPDARCTVVGDSLHCVPWFRSDLDNNGYTDLVVVGGWDDHAIFCILDSGDNRYAVNRLTRKIFQNCTFPLLKKIGNENVLVYYTLNEPAPGKLKVDTLVYKFADFVEYHAVAKNYSIDKVQITAHECLGRCPQFELAVDSDRSAKYTAKKYNKQSGEFEGVIDRDGYAQLIQLLEYIDFPNLSDDYAVNWQDDQDCTLQITYDNGKIKTIRDNGLHGTFGLERVYQILFQWRDNQQWTRIIPGERRVDHKVAESTTARIRRGPKRLFK